jgi:hypothetical protein
LHEDKINCNISSNIPDKKEITLPSEIESLIEELPQASNRRIEEIVSILEGVLSEVECKLPTENDDERAYECLNIPRAKDIIGLIRTWNERDNILKASDGKGNISENGVVIISKLSEELKIVFKQIPLLSL